MEINKEMHGAIDALQVIIPVYHKDDIDNTSYIFTVLIFTCTLLWPLLMFVDFITKSFHTLNLKNMN